MTCPVPVQLTVTVGLRLCDIALAWRPCTARDAERTVTASGAVWLQGEEWMVRAGLSPGDVEPLSRDEERRLREVVDEALVDVFERQTQPL
ncbi:hypothetical protein [Myxococcus sp. CA040A]|uniref:hypothetical protein n=1 Tax=Myxococcus sp. CA040A TaxID=2741738 RepID=UPI00157A2DAC|nr:hypothetical protein [Myxococcus sp. CA040A]NTX08958.1 hypothetical protein [Myxococcus sp. CA040A]